MKLRVRFVVIGLAGLLAIAIPSSLQASENAPHTPFAEWAEVPARGDLVVRATYQESEAYYFWAGNTRFKSDLVVDGEHHGIDINQGYVTLQYGLTERWAADLSVGFTTVGWRFFSTNGTGKSTVGLMDSTVGVRYQVFREGEDSVAWKPTLTLRAGAVIPGTFDESIAFAPGDRSTGIEPEVLARKHFGWEGFGAYADGLFRWNHTAGNDHWIVSVGLFQHIQRWQLNAGYRHLGSVNGDNIQFDSATGVITYPRAPRENQDSIEAGFDYTTKKQLRMGFYSRTVFDGSNTDKKFWVGGFIEMPFSLVKSK